MPEHCVSRTIVKSPPELWAELSDPAALTRHLGELGTITITRLEPEREVAWEGERISGTVALEPAGWGTRVTLEAGAVRAAPPVEDERDEPVAADVAGDGRCGGDGEDAAGPEGDAAAAIDDPALDRPRATAADLGDEEAPAAGEPASRGFFARLTGWWRRRPAVDEPAEDEETRTRDEPPAEELLDADAPADEPELAAAAGADGPEPRPGDPATWAAAHAVEEAQRVDAVLAAALEALGTPRHRPFSRG
jgi:hypothetical protein